MRIAVIIVTCNRKELLGKLLEDIKGQKRQPDGVFVIDNGSEDGTSLFTKEHFPNVILIELNHNSGLFGGLEIGIKTAFQRKYDAVWLVDDDARLKNDTLEQLLKAIDLHDELKEAVIWCANVEPEGQFFTEPVCVKVAGDWKVYHELLPELKDKVYETVGGPNIGIYIPISVIERVGPPRKEMVFCGEIEFIYRVKKAGFKLYRCFASIIYHKRFKFYEVKHIGRTRYISLESPWRTYYEIRNRIFVDLTYKRRTVLKSLLNTAIDSVFKICICDKKILTLVYILKGVYDGLFGRMGLRVNIPRPINLEQE